MGGWGGGQRKREGQGRAGIAAASGGGVTGSGIRYLNRGVGKRGWTAGRCQFTMEVITPSNPPEVVSV